MKYSCTHPYGGCTFYDKAEILTRSGECMPFHFAVEAMGIEGVATEYLEMQKRVRIDMLSAVSYDGILFHGVPSFVTKFTGYTLPYRLPQRASPEQVGKTLSCIDHSLVEEMGRIDCFEACSAGRWMFAMVHFKGH